MLRERNSTMLVTSTSISVLTVGTAWLRTIASAIILRIPVSAISSWPSPAVVGSTGFTCGTLGAAVGAALGLDPRFFR